MEHQPDLRVEATPDTTGAARVLKYSLTATLTSVVLQKALEEATASETASARVILVPPVRASELINVASRMLDAILPEDTDGAVKELQAEDLARSARSEDALDLRPDPHIGLRGKPNGTLFLLRLRSGQIHFCALSGNLPDDISWKAQRLTDYNHVRLEKQKQARYFLLS